MQSFCFRDQEALTLMEQNMGSLSDSRTLISMLLCEHAKVPARLSGPGEVSCKQLRLAPCLLHAPGLVPGAWPSTSFVQPGEKNIWLFP